jgi:hypothetical protein
MILVQVVAGNVYRACMLQAQYSCVGGQCATSYQPGWNVLSDRGLGGEGQPVYGGAQ